MTKIAYSFIAAIALVTATAGASIAADSPTTAQREAFSMTQMDTAAVLRGQIPAAAPTIVEGRNMTVTGATESYIVRSVDQDSRSRS